MSPRVRPSSFFRVLVLGCGFTLGIAAPLLAGDGCTDQSPRRLERWNFEGLPSRVAKGDTENTIVFTPKDGAPVTLTRCSQHYHCWIENLQPNCSGQRATERGGPPGECPVDPAKLPAGSWVEIHTAYSKTPTTPCNKPESLDCCVGDPVVVMGYHARVQADTKPAPTPVDWGLPAAEWSGSNTGPDNGGCKTTRAWWRFSLGCESQITRGQLKEFTHPDRARGLQPPARLSHDLTRVDP